MAAVLATVGLTLSGPAFSHAQMSSADVSGHETHAIQHYSDLVIDAGQDECLHVTPGTPHSHDDGFCGKCCAACFGVSVIPSAPVMVYALPLAGETLSSSAAVLTERAIPIEPGIPKPL